MTLFPYDLDPAPKANLGLIVLQSDERIEWDFRRLIPQVVALNVTRVPSGLDVTPETLQAMEAHIPAAAELLPRPVHYDAVGYGCTSGTAQIGPERIAELTGAGTGTAHVTEPLSALVAACGKLGLKRLAFLSPYVEDVSDRLRNELAHRGVDSPVFGSFAEAEEARVARISPSSVQAAAAALARQGDVDGVFLSCTNLNTLDVIEPLEQQTGLPVLSSNLVLAWHLLTLAGVAIPQTFPGQLSTP